MNTGNIPSLKNSKSIQQAEIQQAQQSMNAAQNFTGGNLTNTTAMGNVPNLQSSNAVGQAEEQKVRQKINTSGNMNPTTGGLS